MAKAMKKKHRFCECICCSSLTVDASLNRAKWGLMSTARLGKLQPGSGNFCTHFMDLMSGTLTQKVQLSSIEHVGKARVFFWDNDSYPAHWWAYTGCIYLVSQKRFRINFFRMSDGREHSQYGFCTQRLWFELWWCPRLQRNQISRALHHYLRQSVQEIRVSLQLGKHDVRMHTPSIWSTSSPEFRKPERRKRQWDPNGLPQHWTRGEGRDSCDWTHPRAWLRSWHLYNSEILLEGKESKGRLLLRDRRSHKNWWQILLERDKSWYCKRYFMLRIKKVLNSIFFVLWANARTGSCPEYLRWRLCTCSRCKNLHCRHGTMTFTTYIWAVDWFCTMLFSRPDLETITTLDIQGSLSFLTL